MNYLKSGQYRESEGVLMVILYDAIFGYICTVFQLTERIACMILKKHIRHEYEDGSNCALGFSYTALSSRHEVT